MIQGVLWRQKIQNRLFASFFAKDLQLPAEEEKLSFGSPAIRRGTRDFASSDCSDFALIGRRSF